MRVRAERDLAAIARDARVERERAVLSGRAVRRGVDLDDRVAGRAAVEPVHVARRVVVGGQQRVALDSKTTKQPSPLSAWALTPEKPAPSKGNGPIPAGRSTSTVPPTGTAPAGAAATRRARVATRNPLTGRTVRLIGDGRQHFGVNSCPLGPGACVVHGLRTDAQAGRCGRITTQRSRSRRGNGSCPRPRDRTPCSHRPVGTSRRGPSPSPSPQSRAPRLPTGAHGGNDGGAQAQ